MFVNFLKLQFVGPLFIIMRCDKYTYVAVTGRKRTLV